MWNRDYQMYIFKKNGVRRLKLQTHRSDLPRYATFILFCVCNQFWQSES